MKYRTPLLIFIISLVFSGIPFFAHAQSASNPTYTLLAPLPCIVGTGNTCTAGSTITSINIQSYASYLFKFLIALAIFLTVVRIIFGGFKYMTVESVTGKSDAKEIIENALWGLLCALASYLILYTIDPRLVSINLVSVPPLTTTAANGTVAGMASSSYLSAPYTPQNTTNFGVSGASSSTPVTNDTYDDPSYYNTENGNTSETPSSLSSQNNSTQDNSGTSSLPSSFVSDTNNQSGYPIDITAPPQNSENTTGTAGTTGTSGNSSSGSGSGPAATPNSTPNNNPSSYPPGGIALPAPDASAQETYSAASSNINAYYQQAVSLQDPSQLATAVSAINAIYSDAISQLQSQNDVVDVANLQFQANLATADIDAYTQQLTLTDPTSNSKLTQAQWQTKQQQVVTSVQNSYNQMANSATSQAMTSQINSYAQTRINAIASLQYNNWNNVVPQ